MREMNRGKEKEKITSPMFPRLDVNDRERGGPRAPPRNKMALHEQLSIPSQRFNSRFKPNYSNYSTASSTQGNENKRPMFFPLHLDRSTDQGENSNASSSDFNTSSAAPQKKLDEEDFMVPVFVEPESSQILKNSDSTDEENVSFSRPAHTNSSSRNRSTCNKEPKQYSATFSNLRQKVRYQTDKLKCLSEEQKDRENFTNDEDKMQRTNSTSLNEGIDGSQLENASNGECYKDKVGYLLGIQNGDRCGDDLDTSMLDSVSHVDISPDDVVRVIGQKHFWKARKTMVNQQRIFAVQVFELHRLIKVQRSFAGSPNLLVEDAAYLGKPMKSPIRKDLSLELSVRPSSNTEKRKAVQLKNPIEEPEGADENAVGKSSLSSSQKETESTPASMNSQPTPVTADPRTNPWYFNQPPGHHWLVPVMSPTEGLIYKPYPGPGHTGSDHMINNFSNPSYGFPNPHHLFQGIELPPGFPPMSQAYFPPYGMPYAGPNISGSAVDQVNHFAVTGFSEQQKSSCSAPTQSNNEPSARSFCMGNESNVQVNAASSSGEGRNGLRLSLTSPADDAAMDNQARVIKVVPYNAVSANETAFKIFQSIQKEREHNEFE